MTRARGRAPRSRPAPTGAAPGPLRTCLGCRQVRPQAELVRLVRGSDGLVEPDPWRRRGGRGAYLCRSARCLDEAMRRRRWPQAFRAPATLTPAAADGVRALLVEGRLGPGPTSPGWDDGIQVAARGSGQLEAPVEGGW